MTDMTVRSNRAISVIETYCQIPRRPHPATITADAARTTRPAAMMMDSVAPSEVQPPLNAPGPIGSIGGSSAGSNKYDPANSSAPEDAEKLDE